jgi:hypothetical protein
VGLVTTVPLKLGHRGGSDDTPGAELQQGLYPNGAIEEVRCHDGTDLSGQVDREHPLGHVGCEQQV